MYSYINGLLNNYSSWFNHRRWLR